MKYSHLLVPLITIGTVCAQDEVEIPDPHLPTRPPSKNDVDIMVEDDDGESCTSGEYPGMSSGATTQGAFSPAPEPDCVSGVFSHIPVPQISLGKAVQAVVQKPVQVFVYNDKGVMANVVDLWTTALREVLVAPVIVQPVTAKEIQSGKLEEERCTLFIIPGGIATQYDLELKAEGKQEIKNFANRGGKCLGVGAGAYFLSSRSSFAMPGSGFIEREGVGLAQVTASGPFSPFLSSSSQFSMPGNGFITREGVGLAQVTASGPFSPVDKTRFDQGGTAFPITYVQDQHKLQFFAFCNGGCVFEGHSSEDVIATSVSGQAIIVKAGDNTVLSGVHPEFSPKWIPESSPFHQETLTQTSRYLLRIMLSSLSLI